MNGLRMVKVCNLIVDWIFWQFTSYFTFLFRKKFNLFYGKFSIHVKWDIFLFVLCLVFIQKNFSWIPFLFFSFRFSFFLHYKKTSSCFHFNKKKKLKKLKVFKIKVCHFIVWIHCSRIQKLKEINFSIKRKAEKKKREKSFVRACSA
jgi:hypothetical protein